LFDLADKEIKKEKIIQIIQNFNTLEDFSSVFGFEIASKKFNWDLFFSDKTQKEGIYKNLLFAAELMWAGNLDQEQIENDFIKHFLNFSQTIFFQNTENSQPIKNIFCLLENLKS
jgi:hypothetical protein